MCEQETFWTLLTNAAHWYFELFLMFLFDVVIGLAVWPFVRKHWKHHVTRDEASKEKTTSNQMGCY